MSDETEIQVNFGKPMPVFPLGAVMLMPHAVLPLLIFEPRYRQMIENALDGAGQIAMGIFEGDDWRQDYEGTPPLRDAVCVGQITRHQKLPDGRYHVWLHGVCRARILQELGPNETRLYRLVMLEPVGVADIDEQALEPYRARFTELLTDTSLSTLSNAKAIVKHLANDEVPTSAILELLTVSVLHDTEARYYPELHYRLLAEGDASRRAELILNEMQDLRTLLQRAEKQRHADAPRGCTWN
ncbi:MAG: LON peptidase substrate-binding domain-containing protein [Phycisphaerales bacterium]